MVDALVLNYNDADTTIKFLKKVSLYNNIRKIVVVDNCSTDDSLKKLQKYQNNKIDIIASKNNGGYGAGNNLGIRYLFNQYESPFILLSNPDVIVEESTIEKMEKFLCANLDYTIVAPFMLNSNKKKQFNTAFKIPNNKEYILSLEMLFSKLKKTFYYKGIEEDDREIRQVGAVSGSMFLMNTEKMLKYGMFDENIFLYCEEVVLGLRLQKTGQKTALLLQESFIHDHSVSINKTFKSEAKKKKLLVKSKLYVIKNYYKTRGWWLAIAYFLGGISIIESAIVSIIRRKK